MIKIMNKFFKQCIFLFCHIGMVSCVQIINPTSAPETSLGNNDAIQETPLATSTTNDNLTTQLWGINDISVQTLESRQIAYGDIAEIWWSDDSETLYYGVHLEGNFAYDFQRQATEKINVEDVLNQTPQPAILQRLPPYYYLSPHISPSGNRVTYIKQSDTPLWPTISPEVEGGEALIPRYDLEMWLWEDGFSYSLGTIKQCWLKDAFWSNNEQKVVLVEYGPIPSCLDTFTSPQAWLFNLDNRTSHPLFLQPEYPAVQVYGFSSDGVYLLHGFYSYETGANLFLLDVNGLNSFMIDAPVETFLEWISDTEILVTYRNGINVPPYPVGILNLQSLEFCNLRISTNDQHVRHVKISPDKQWIAFTTRQQFLTPDGRQSFTPEKLWISEFDRDTCQ